jgi:hypothetical protein
LRATDAVAYLRRFVWNMNQNNVTSNGRLDAVEATVKALQEEPRGLRYCGTWQRAQDYHPP